jgi:hypothetical protein
MNDKIKQLAEEAGFLLWEDEPWKPEGAIIDWSSNYDSALERYTELIVRKCGSVLVEIEGSYAALLEERLLEHFGLNNENI